MSASGHAVDKTRGAHALAMRICADRLMVRGHLDGRLRGESGRHHEKGRPSHNQRQHNPPRRNFGSFDQSWQRLAQHGLHFPGLVIAVPVGPSLLIGTFALGPSAFDVVDDCGDFSVDQGFAEGWHVGPIAWNDRCETISGDAKQLCV